MNKKDEENFPPDQMAAVFDGFEKIFASSLMSLGLSKESLKNKSEFDFDSGDAANLESGIAVLRVVNVLESKNYVNLTLIKPKKNSSGADLTAEMNGVKVCFEVKAITKQSSGRRSRFFADQLYEKILESLPQARKQLESSARELQCPFKILCPVVNWTAQSIYLGEGSLQQVVDKLEQNGEQRSLDGIDGVWLIMRMGNDFLFLSHRARPFLDPK